MPTSDPAAPISSRIAAVWRQAAAHPGVGPQLAALGYVLQVNLTEPDAALTVELRDPIVVREDHVDPDADLAITMSSVIADRYWRGQYNLAVGLARDRIEVAGSVESLLELVPLTRPLFPSYRAAAGGG